MDMVFNYGTFDDSDPDFYIKFTKGIMRYALSAYPFSDFLMEYQYQNRGIVEQTLLLSCEEKTRIFKALQLNNTDANRFYNYYFHTDNCTTRAKDMIVKEIRDSSFLFKDILPPNSVTFRNLIHVYLNNGNQPWSKFGIDLFLGTNLDKKTTNEEAMFLPDYLKKGFDSALIHRRPLVSQSHVILPWPQEDKNPNSLLTPFFLFSALLIIVGVISLNKTGRSHKALLFFDSVFFLIIGLLGILMALLWIIRIDTVCRNNFNILWALPTHVVAAFFLFKKKIWIPKYFQITFWIGIALAFAWLFIPQQLNSAVGPILLLIIIRSYYHSKKIT
jgi:Domain of unknown function (DUF4105)